MNTLKFPWSVCSRTLIFNSQCTHTRCENLCWTWISRMRMLENQKNVFLESKLRNKSHTWLACQPNSFFLAEISMETAHIHTQNVSHTMKIRYARNARNRMCKMVFQIFRMRSYADTINEESRKKTNKVFWIKLRNLLECGAMFFAFLYCNYNNVSVKGLN